MFLISLKTSRLKKNFDLLGIIGKTLKKNGAELKSGDVLVISSKVLALSQGRILNLKNITPSRRALALQKKRTRYGEGKEDPRVIELVLQEADAVLPGTLVLTFKEGILIPNAGIDLSNAPKDFAILWPRNPWKTARNLWQRFRRTFRLKKLGIIISDSHCSPLRWGVSGLAVSWAGFEGVEDARGQKDIYGKPLLVTRKAVADNLTSAALLLMGEAGEKIPFVIVRNAPVKFTNRMQRKEEIFIAPEACIFRGMYNKKALNIFKKKRDHA